jgi:putative iron-dependent peroxidase
MTTTPQPTGQVPQPVLSPLTGVAIFLVVTIDAGGEPAARDLLADCASLERSVGFRAPEGGLKCVVSVGSDAWSRLFSGPRPAELHAFRELVGGRHRAVSTPGDLLFHIRAGQMDLCFELAGQVMNRLRGAATVVDEVHGFKYFEVRDLLGFVDGTENPTGPRAYDAVTVGAETPRSPAAATWPSRSTSMTSMPGTRCPSRRRSWWSAAPSSPTSSWRMTSSRATRTWRST